LSEKRDIFGNNELCHKTVHDIELKNNGQEGAATRQQVGIRNNGVNTEILNVRIIDDQDTPTQTDAINADGGNIRKLSGHLEQGINYSGGTIDKFVETTGYVTANSGSASVADTDTIAHGLDETPSYVNLTASVDGHIAVATAVDATSITVGLVDDAGSAVGTAETVYWEAKVR